MMLNMKKRENGWSNFLASFWVVKLAKIRFSLISYVPLLSKWHHEQLFSLGWACIYFSLVYIPWVSAAMGSSNPWVIVCLGRLYFSSNPLYFFPFSLFFACLLSFLPFPCSSVWENTQAWVPLFLLPYWMELNFFALLLSTLFFLLISY